MLRGPSSLGTCRCKRRPGSAAPSGGSSRIEHGGDVLLIGVSLAILGLLFCVYTLNRQVIGLKISLSESYEATMGMERVRKVSNLGLEVTLSSLTKLTQDLRGQLASQAENVHTLQLQVRDLRREAGLDPSDGQAFQSTPIGSEASSASLIPSAPLEGGGIGLVNVLSEWTEGRQLPGFEAGCKNISSLYAGDDGDGAEEDGYGRSGGHRLCLDGFRARREEESPGRCLVYDFVVFPRGGSFTKVGIWHPFNASCHFRSGLLVSIIPVVPSFLPKGLHLLMPLAGVATAGVRSSHIQSSWD